MTVIMVVCLYLQIYHCSHAVSGEWWRCISIVGTPNMQPLTGIIYFQDLIHQILTFDFVLFEVEF